jgi:hypothetical protein
MEVIAQTRYNSKLTITPKTPILSEVNVELHRMEEVWKIMEEPDVKAALPLEVLVRCFRLAIRLKDDPGRNRIMEMSIRRTQSSNEYWSRQVLNRVHLTSEERCMFACQ